MVLCPDQIPSMFQRFPSSPHINYPFNGFEFNALSDQHPQEYSRCQMNEPGVPPAWYGAMYGSRNKDWTYIDPIRLNTNTNTPSDMCTNAYQTGPMGPNYGQPQCHGSSDSPGDMNSSNSSSGSLPNKQLRAPYDWMKKVVYQSAPVSGKTRTKDKYRVVYSDHQRLELEKEFRYSRYITIIRKAELAQALTLSERQVKIWYQNRRAKERKQNKKCEENHIVKTASVHGDLSDETMHQMQQKIPMEITPPTHHHVHVALSSPESIHAHNSRAYTECQGQQQITSKQSISPQNLMVNHNQFSSAHQLNL